jgi:hypothetical protein
MRAFLFHLRVLGWLSPSTLRNLEEVYDIMQDYIIWLTFSATPPGIFTIHIVPGYGMGAIVKGKRDSDEASFKELLMKNLANTTTSKWIDEIIDETKTKGYKSLMETKIRLSDGAAKNLGWEED